MIGYYMMHHRSTKWWRRIFHYLMMASTHNAYVVTQDSNPEKVRSEWPNFQDFLEEIVISLIGDLRTKRDPAVNPHPTPGAGKHDIRKMYNRKKMCVECSMAAEAGARRGTTHETCLWPGRHSYE